jgi:deoxyribonuclease (pyrimidine dimer)
MVRVNLISPEKLADQHLIAEYNEILMLVGFVKKFPNLEGIPKNYVLGKGHINFFKNKLGYLRERHKELRREMAVRGFKINKELNLKEFSKEYFCDWKPEEKDLGLIRKRIQEKIGLKSNFYRYYGKKMDKDFFIELLR